MRHRSDLETHKSHEIYPNILILNSNKNSLFFNKDAGFRLETQDECWYNITLFE